MAHIDGYYSQGDCVNEISICFDSRKSRLTELDTLLCCYDWILLMYGTHVFIENISLCPQLISFFACIFLLTSLLLIHSWSLYRAQASVDRICVLSSVPSSRCLIDRTERTWERRTHSWLYIVGDFASVDHQAEASTREHGDRIQPSRIYLVFRHFQTQALVVPWTFLFSLVNRNIAGCLWL